jgi:hypothetical protein
MVAMIFYTDSSQKRKLYKVAQTTQEEITFYWEAEEMYGAANVEVVQY